MKPGHYPWILVAALWVVAFLNYIDRQIIFSVFPLLQRELGLSSVELGLLSTVFLWVYGLLSPVAGFAADRFGRERIILFSILVWSAVTWATAHAGNLRELLLTRALMGISESCYIPAALALIATHHGERTRSLATGLHQSGLYAGIALGGVGGGWIGERFGWRPAFTILGVLGVAYVGPLWAVLRPGRVRVPVDAPPLPRRLVPSLVRLFSLRGFVVMTAVFSSVSVANWIVYTWLPLYLFERFHMNLTSAGFSATFYIQAACLTGILAGGWLADRWSQTTCRGRVWTQVIGLLVAGPCLFLAGFTSSQMWLATGLILFGLGKGFYDCNTMPVLCQIAPEEQRSTGYGIFNLAGCLTGGVMVAAAGSLKDTIGLSGAFQVAAVVLFLSGILLLRVRPERALAC